VNRAAVPPNRRTDAAHASAARTLLTPKLFARTRNQLLVLRGVRAGSLSRTIVLYRFPEQVLVHPAEYFRGEFEFSYFLAGQIYNINGSHFSSFTGPHLRRPFGFLPSI
jgi:hypothetical protein